MFINENSTYYPTPEHPFREALLAVVGKEPPAFVKGFGTQGLSDPQIQELQDWCSLNARPHWATGLSMMEAAELIVAGAIENANIARVYVPEPTPKKKPTKKAKWKRSSRFDGST